MTNEKKFEVHAEITVRLTQQDVDDIMVSALEGGICYWCDRVTVEGQYLCKYASEYWMRADFSRWNAEGSCDGTV